MKGTRTILLPMIVNDTLGILIHFIRGDIGGNLMREFTFFNRAMDDHVLIWILLIYENYGMRYGLNGSKKDCILVSKALGKKYLSSYPLN